jgi:hypothetical protein
MSLEHFLGGQEVAYDDNYLMDVGFGVLLGLPNINTQAFRSEC